MKRLSVFVVMIMIFLLAACGSNNTENRSDSEAQTEGNIASEENAVSNRTEKKSEAAEDTEADSKILVAYYSATGSTKKVAETIAEHTGADMFEIIPKDEYTSADLDWTKEDSRVSLEHDDPDNRHVELVTTEVENFSQYDTVFIGYPIWWGIAAWPVDDFVKGNDFDGKMVIPFCTAASSGIGESGELLAKMAGTGEWQEGIRFYSSVSADEVNSWLDSLND